MSLVPPQPTHHPASAVDRAADQLRRSIFDGQLASGTPLREIPLADTLGVGRSTVREALTVLVAEGLAVHRPHRGVSVGTPDPDTVHDLCLARSVLESSGARRWADADPAARDAVRRCLDRYAEAVERGASYFRLNERHLALHLSFVALTGSPRLIAMAASVQAELKLALAQVDRMRRNPHDQLDDHRRLVAAIEAGDADAATRAVEGHLTDAEAAILESLAL